MNKISISAEDALAKPGFPEPEIVSKNSYVQFWNYYYDSNNFRRDLASQIHISLRLPNRSTSRRQHFDFKNFNKTL